MENNNVDYFYVCFFDIIRDNAHYLVTTDPTNNLHQLITIKMNNMEGENSIVINDYQVIIHYNGYIIVISNKMTLDKIDELVNFTQEEVLVYDKTYANSWFLCKNWTLNLKTLKVLSAHPYSLCGYGYIFNFRILSLTCISSAHLKNNINSINNIINNNISDFNMSKLFPYLETIIIDEKVFYSRD